MVVLELIHAQFGIVASRHGFFVHEDVQLFAVPERDAKISGLQRRFHLTANAREMLTSKSSVRWIVLRLRPVPISSSPTCGTVLGFPISTCWFDGIGFPFRDERKGTVTVVFTKKYYTRLTINRLHY